MEISEKCRHVASLEAKQSLVYRILSPCKARHVSDSWERKEKGTRVCDPKSLAFKPLTQYARQDLNLQPLAPEAVHSDSQKAA